MIERLSLEAKPNGFMDYFILQPKTNWVLPYPTLLNRKIQDHYLIRNIHHKEH